MKTSLHIVCENRLLEEQIVHQLFDAFGSDIAFELLDEFVSMLDNSIGRLQQARASQDHAALMYIAHRLTGTAAMYGATQLANISASSKARVRKGAVSSITDDCDQLIIMCMKTRLVCIAFLSECRSYCAAAEKVEPKVVAKLLENIQRAA